uniref:Gypsy retrotransposon integrase-like protein 1 n=1 Tax=Chrysemys picta bellii TaxID=8478 RepID=A0A8C3P8K5_CHRPI
MVRSGKNGGLHLKQISYYKRTGEYHPTTLASERSGIRRAAKKFVFKENKLFYVGKDRKQMHLVIVSDEEKKRVLRKCHETAAGAHHGISRTLTLVESSYYWTSITNDVKQWVYACQHCQVAKNTAIIVPKLHPIKAEDPWTAVTIDLMGPFNTTRRNHMYVIMMTDLFTKWVVVLPLQDTSAVEIAKAMVSVFFLYGPLKKMVIDQAEEFVHQINRELFELFGMKQIVLSYPQTDDTNERTCKTIKTFLNKYCADHPNDWDDNLSAIAYAFNLTPMAPVQNTPYFQMFNRNPYVSETSNVPQEAQKDNKCMFAKILEAIKQADRVLEERKATGGGTGPGLVTLALWGLAPRGIKGKILSWIENWLKDREQRVGINGKFSEWRGVTSGVPQGSVLRPILFSLFINDLEKGVKSEVAKFADDTKLLKIVKTKADCEELQKDLTKLSDWATKWQMKFNVDKCKVMHIGKNNPNYTHNMMGANLATTNQERDLGVIVDSSLKTFTQCAVAVRKANRMLGIIKKGIEIRQRISYCPYINPWYAHILNTAYRCGLLISKKIYWNWKRYRKGNKND